MSSSKPQKKSVKKEEPQIKTEKTGLFPISHYVDDRVELVKQIFSSLKGKTIRNLAPIFLKESTIEEIEELCLNELLGLSEKRLLAIINATKCPTDTESSSDSDVHNIEDHISLEEISSDSETEKNGASKPKKTKKNRTSSNQQTDAKDKSVSVLELLELQARARAIRSQLALEPVAKIEVDSDDSTDEGLRSTETKNASTSKTKGSNESAQSLVKATSNGTNPTLQRNRIKLKRNFRKKSNTENENSTIQTPGRSQDEIVNIEVPMKTDETKPIEQNSSRGEVARSPSPDVITILPSPELLCISDSNEEDEGTVNNPSSQSASLTKGINECFRKVDSSQDADQANSVAISSVEVLNVHETSEPEKNDSPKDISEELEDGEIVDGKESIETEDMRETAELVNNTGSNNGKPMGNESEEINCEKVMAEAEQKLDAADECFSGSDCNQINIEKHSIKSEMLTSAKLNEQAIDDDNHQNDDVISLCNEDFDDDLQMGRKSESNVKRDSPNREKERIELAANEPLDSDIINLDNSSDDESTLGQFSDGTQSQSWNYRWLKSDRVSKILATSRLGNRVRDKIKKSKKACESAEEVGISDQPKEVFHSQFEDGSVQQYAEILEKTS